MHFTVAYVSSVHPVQCHHSTFSRCSHEVAVSGLLFSPRDRRSHINFKSKFIKPHIGSLTCSRQVSAESSETTTAVPSFQVTRLIWLSGHFFFVMLLSIQNGPAPPYRPYRIFTLTRRTRKTTAATVAPAAAAVRAAARTTGTQRPTAPTIMPTAARITTTTRGEEDGRTTTMMPTKTRMMRPCQMGRERTLPGRHEWDNIFLLSSLYFIFLVATWLVWFTHVVGMGLRVRVGNLKNKVNGEEHHTLDTKISRTHLLPK